jgi:hypothetical protein
LRVEPGRSRIVGSRLWGCAYCDNRRQINGLEYVLNDTAAKKALSADCSAILHHIDTFVKALLVVQVDFLSSREQSNK